MSWFVLHRFHSASFKTLVKLEDTMALNVLPRIWETIARIGSPVQTGYTGRCSCAKSSAKSTFDRTSILLAVASKMRAVASKMSPTPKIF